MSRQMYLPVNTVTAGVLPSVVDGEAADRADASAELLLRVGLAYYHYRIEYYVNVLQSYVDARGRTYIEARAQNVLVDGPSYPYRAKALQLMKRAAEIITDGSSDKERKASSEACLLLALECKHAKKPDESAAWLMKAFEKGSIKALQELVVYYAEKQAATSTYWTERQQRACYLLAQAFEGAASEPHIQPQIELLRASLPVEQLRLGDYRDFLSYSLLIDLLLAIYELYVVAAPERDSWKDFAILLTAMKLFPNGSIALQAYFATEAEGVSERVKALHAEVDLLGYRSLRDVLVNQFVNELSESVKKQLPALLDRLIEHIRSTNTEMAKHFINYYQSVLEAETLSPVLKEKETDVIPEASSSEIERFMRNHEVVIQADLKAVESPDASPALLYRVGQFYLSYYTGKKKTVYVDSSSMNSSYKEKAQVLIQRAAKSKIEGLSERETEACAEACLFIGDSLLNANNWDYAAEYYMQAAKKACSTTASGGALTGLGAHCIVNMADYWNARDKYAPSYVNKWAGRGTVLLRAYFGELVFEQFNSNDLYNLAKLIKSTLSAVSPAELIFWDKLCCAMMIDYFISSYNHFVVDSENKTDQWMDFAILLAAMKLYPNGSTTLKTYFATEAEGVDKRVKELRAHPPAICNCYEIARSELINKFINHLSAAAKPYLSVVIDHVIAHIGSTDTATAKEFVSFYQAVIEADAADYVPAIYDDAGNCTEEAKGYPSQVEQFVKMHAALKQLSAAPVPTSKAVDMLRAGLDASVTAVASPECTAVAVVKVVERPPAAKDGLLAQGLYRSKKPERPSGNEEVHSPVKTSGSIN